ncbi:hypothetical protein M8J75_008869 [Diaphorina citri]|nr:hypothetical protein M8J75_008869 [Diaphorina citri]KAI5742357.1 hypothetical protein M8J77_006489 [Diaphorina citri]
MHSMKIKVKEHSLRGEMKREKESSGFGRQASIECTNKEHLFYHARPSNDSGYKEELNYVTGNRTAGAISDTILLPLLLKNDGKCFKHSSDYFRRKRDHSRFKRSTHVAS